MIRWKSVIALAFLVFTVPSVECEESNQASQSTLMKELFDCESVFVAKFSSYESRNGWVGWNNPPLAHYYLEDYLKGPPLGGRMIVRYSFYDTSTKTPPPSDWKLKKSMMPTKNSKWIIALPNAVPSDGAFETYHGSVGRIEASQENIESFLVEVERRKALELVLEKEKIRKIKEIIDNSEGIYVGEYKSTRIGRKGTEIGATWFKPPIAYFRPFEYLKGPPISVYMPIRFEFHDGKQTPPPNWKFSQSLMPAEGSKWILAIPNCVPLDGAFLTYQGSVGRVEATKENLALFYQALEQSKKHHQ